MARSVIYLGAIGSWVVSVRQVLDERRQQLVVGFQEAPTYYDTGRYWMGETACTHACSPRGCRFAMRDHRLLALP